jgi:hypothetical protein
VNPGTGGKFPVPGGFRLGKGLLPFGFRGLEISLVKKNVSPEQRGPYPQGRIIGAYGRPPGFIQCIQGGIIAAPVGVFRCHFKICFRHVPGREYFRRPLWGAAAGRKAERKAERKAQRKARETERDRPGKTAFIPYNSLFDSSLHGSVLY